MLQARLPIVCAYLKKHERTEKYYPAQQGEVRIAKDPCVQSNEWALDGKQNVCLQLINAARQTTS
jgi:methionine aminopeptidase